ncbi:MAG: SpaA isopeptide-forming pilin-related protein [Oscillospiraceae bacterium]|nr:SpaA isopeptide-forming pilin-related protein [Oscillospiraceae bacterium]
MANSRLENDFEINLFSFKYNIGVSGARFSLKAQDGELVSVTDEFGRARFRGIADGEYILTQTFMPEGHESEAVNFGVLVQNGVVYINRKKQNRINLPLFYSGWLKLTVRENGREKPCEPVVLTANSNRVSCSTMSDNNGNVHFYNIPPGEYRAFLRNLPKAHTVEIRVLNNGVVLIGEQDIPTNEHVFDILGYSGFRVGIVSPCEGNLCGCAVNLTVENDSEPQKLTAFTNADGNATFGCLKSGRYKGKITCAPNLKIDDSEFSVEIDDDGIVVLNGVPTDFIKISLTPLGFDSQNSYFFVKDELNRPLCDVPFEVDTGRTCENLLSDQNGKVILTGLRREETVKISPGKYPGFAPPRPFEIKYKNGEWQSPKVVYKKSKRQIKVTKAFVWRDFCNINNTRNAVDIHLYIDGTFRETKTIDINQTIQKFEFNIFKSNSFNIVIGELPDGYRLTQVENGYIFELTAVRVNVNALLETNGITMDKSTHSFPYASAVTIRPEILGECLKPTPQGCFFQNLIEDEECLFVYS